MLVSSCHRISNFFKQFSYYSPDRNQDNWVKRNQTDDMQPHADALNNNSLQQYGCHRRKWEVQLWIPCFQMISCLHHIHMMSPDTRTVKTEATAQSCYTQRQMILQHFITAGYKCLPGSWSLLFRLWLKLSLSHILSGRKTHEPKIRLQVTLEPGKLFGRMSVSFVTPSVLVPLP